MNPKLAPLLRHDLNPAYLGEEDGILRYLNPADLAGDNGKYKTNSTTASPRCTTSANGWRGSNTATASPKCAAK